MRVAVLTLTVLAGCVLAWATIISSQKQAIEFVYWRDMTGAEASHALQVPLGTFKSRVKDALATLQVALGQSS